MQNSKASLFTEILSCDPLNLYPHGVAGVIKFENFKLDYYAKIPLDEVMTALSELSQENIDTEIFRKKWDFLDDESIEHALAYIRGANSVVDVDVSILFRRYNSGQFDLGLGTSSPLRNIWCRRFALLMQYFEQDTKRLLNRSPHLWLDPKCGEARLVLLKSAFNSIYPLFQDAIYEEIIAVLDRKIFPHLIKDNSSKMIFRNVAARPRQCIHGGRTVFRSNEEGYICEINSILPNGNSFIRILPEENGRYHVFLNNSRVGFGWKNNDSKIFVYMDCPYFKTPLFGSLTDWYMGNQYKLAAGSWYFLEQEWKEAAFVQPEVPFSRVFTLAKLRVKRMPLEKGAVGGETFLEYEGYLDCLTSQALYIRVTSSFSYNEGIRQGSGPEGYYNSMQCSISNAKDIYSFELYDARLKEEGVPHKNRLGVAVIKNAAPLFDGVDFIFQESQEEGDRYLLVLWARNMLPRDNA